jgi:hypothetical protein
MPVIWKMQKRTMPGMTSSSFNVATYLGGSGDLEVADISPPVEDTWDIVLADVVEVNALAVPADRDLTYRVMQHELRLLLSFLVDMPGSPLIVRHTEFRASSGHVKRFISESFGLGMLTAAAERHYQWKLNSSDLHNFDVLPAKVAAQYPSSGIRPDLLFEFNLQGHGKRLAGEALAWSGWNDLHP